MNDSSCRNRILWILLTLWAVLCAARAVDLAVLRRSELQSRARKIALHTGTLPVIRGRIITQDGKVLAWSEVEFVLTPTRDLQPEELLTLKKTLSRRDFTAGAESFFPVGQLTAAELAALEELIDRHYPLKIVRRIRRKCIDDEHIRTLVGETCNGSGISGWELEYDAELAGTPGKYQVLTDRHGRWLDHSWQLLEKPVPSQDVQLEVSFSELPEVTQ